MKTSVNANLNASQPELIYKTIQLSKYLKNLTIGQIKTTMKVSDELAKSTKLLINSWSASESLSSVIDSFKGDIYSGLQAQTFNQTGREYANEHLRILSGLYGILKPFDIIHPYRLEMGYKLLNEPFNNLYKFWGKDLANALPDNEIVVDLTSVEYGKAIIPYLSKDKVITPKFLSINPKTGQPVVVAVHSKIARGAFAHWMIINQIDKIEELINFKNLGYKYSESDSSENHPVYICHEFGGKGLSIRLV
jgi:cytoplasmic iron level regulating protein YaaA (DUF328/UPF0246 family)